MVWLPIDYIEVDILQTTSPPSTHLFARDKLPFCRFPTPASTYERVRESYHFSPRRCCVPNRHLPLTAKAPALVSADPAGMGCDKGREPVASARIERELLGKSMQANHACAMLTAPCHHRMEACVEGNWIRKEGPL